MSNPYAPIPTKYCACGTIISAAKSWCWECRQEREAFAKGVYKQKSRVRARKPREVGRP